MRRQADLELNAIGLSSCVTAMGRGRQWALALELLRLRPADQPDTMSCNSAIVACGGQWWRIFELLCLGKKMKKGGIGMVKMMVRVLALLGIMVRL